MYWPDNYTNMMRRLRHRLAKGFMLIYLLPIALLIIADLASK